MGLREQVDGPDVEEDPAIDAEGVAEGLARDRGLGADDGAEEGGESVDGEPPHRRLAVPGAAQDVADGVEPVGEVVADHGEKDEQAGGGVDAEGEADPKAVDEAVGG